jgi:hypothetical protein
MATVSARPTVRSDRAGRSLQGPGRVGAPAEPTLRPTPPRVVPATRRAVLRRPPTRRYPRAPPTQPAPRPPKEPGHRPRRSPWSALPPPLPAKARACAPSPSAPIDPPVAPCRPCSHGLVHWQRRSRRCHRTRACADSAGRAYPQHDPRRQRRQPAATGKADQDRFEAGSPALRTVVRPRASGRRTGSIPWLRADGGTPECGFGPGAPRRRARLRGVRCTGTCGPWIAVRSIPPPWPRRSGPTRPIRASTPP